MKAYRRITIADAAKQAALALALLFLVLVFVMTTIGAIAWLWAAGYTAPAVVTALLVCFIVLTLTMYCMDRLQ